MTTRREFVERATLSAVGLALPIGAEPARAAPRHGVDDVVQPATGYLDLRREPSRVLVHLASGEQVLTRGTNGRWTGDNGIVVATTLTGDATRITLQSPSVPIKRVMLRWSASLSDVRLMLGDAWERGYGDLEWRAWVPDRLMPWYVATWNGTRTDAYGVRTGASAFCSWQVDPEGVTMWADVRSGSAAVQLGERTLNVCDIVSRQGRAGENAFAALRAFCKQMCPNPRLPSAPVYGSNDWYWAYGNNTAATVRADAQHIVELSPAGGNRPFAVIDDGWQPGRGKEKAGTGAWDRGNDKFGDMAALAAEVRTIGARPGIWIRPLQASAETPDTWRLSRDKNVLDPTVPEVRKKVMDDVARVRAWGYELIKHDYTTFEIFGRWGFQMGAAMTRDGWTFSGGPSRTTAEVINALYADIRSAAGDALVIGCNTVSHLSAGQFEICRTGDDTSGTEWSRTRKMGVNTLAFRAPQHGTFYVSDADCVGVTNAVPWSLNRQWLDALARSGTMLFTSLAPDALGTQQRNDLRAALALAAVPQPLAEPLDWMQNVYPSRWKMNGTERHFDWIGENGPGLP